MGLGSGIRDPEKTYSGSRGQKGTGSRIRIRNTAPNHKEAYLSREASAITNNICGEVNWRMKNVPGPGVRRS